MSETVPAKGEIKKFNVGDNFEYDVYVPETITPNTKVVVYEPGGDYNNDWRPFSKELEANGSDAIIIRASGYRGTTQELIEATLNEYNISVNNVIFDGHSAGGTLALKDIANFIAAHPNEVEAPIATFTDGCLEYIYPTKREVEILKDSNAVILAFAQPGYWQIENYKKLAKFGVNIVIAVRRDLTDSDFWIRHATMNASYPSGGILDFVSGKGEPPEEYEFITYNPTTNSFLTVDPSLIKDIDSIYELFDINTLNIKIEKLTALKDYKIQTDSTTVNYYLNTIIKKIQNSKFITENFNSFTGSSSTNVPSEIQDVIYNYYNKVARTLTNIVNLTDSISRIDTSYQELDENLTAMIDTKN